MNGPAAALARRRSAFTQLPAPPTDPQIPGICAILTTWSLEDDHVLLPESVQQLLAEVNGREGGY
jgi:hypothetical protein